jgi:predicted GTPase
MMRLKLWQWIVLAVPIILVVGFLLVSAELQIHRWGINWIWGVFTLLFLGWRWLLVKWTRSAATALETVIAQISQPLETAATTQTTPTAENHTTEQLQAALQQILTAAQNDPPIWQDWQTFWQRCQQLVVAVAKIYHPEVKYPLLNIYIPQAYELIRGTVNDLDLWIQKLSPALNQVTVGQAYQAYEIYQRLEPSVRKLWRAWGWAQWLFNPAAAAVKKASQHSSEQANQELLVNLSQIFREAALRNLCRQAIVLYGKTTTLPVSPVSTPAIPKAKAQTLRDILLTQAEPTEVVEQKPLNVLVAGRAKAGKSSLINTLFAAELAAVDILPATDRIQNYHWQTTTGETLTLWDTPGYEQINCTASLQASVLAGAQTADLLLLVTPAVDPALQMDVDFLHEITKVTQDLKAIAVVTQVDRLRPLREWEPPYNWEWGDRPKEIAIREATEYRAQFLGELCDLVLPAVTADLKTNRSAWGVDALSIALIEAIAPLKQLRLARFCRDLEARTLAAAKIIDNYTFQMTTTKGLAQFLKSPVLQFLSTLATGSPALAPLLAEQIPVEQLPVAIGKLQMAWDLYSLLNTSDNNLLQFDLLSLWPLLLENSASSERNAWAFGHSLIEYWTQNLTVEQLKERFQYYLQQG